MVVVTRDYFAKNVEETSRFELLLIPALAYTFFGVHILPAASPSDLTAKAA